MNIYDAIEKMKEGKIMEYKGISFIWHDDHITLAIDKIATGNPDWKAMASAIYAIEMNITTDDWTYVEIGKNNELQPNPNWPKRNNYIHILDGNTSDNNMHYKYLIGNINPYTGEQITSTILQFQKGLRDYTPESDSINGITDSELLEIVDHRLLNLMLNKNDDVLYKNVKSCNISEAIGHIEAALFLLNNTEDQKEI